MEVRRARVVAPSVPAPLPEEAPALGAPVIALALLAAAPAADQVPVEIARPPVVVVADTLPDVAERAVRSVVNVSRTRCASARSSSRSATRSASARP